MAFSILVSLPLCPRFYAITLHGFKISSPLRPVARHFSRHGRAVLVDASEEGLASHEQT